LCHPDPRFGGSRFDHVIGAMFEALPHAGVAVLRFDFRATYDGGLAERLDVIAGLDELERRCPGTPLHVAGYSFGALVALAVDDPRVVTKLAIAPPLAMASVEQPIVPTLVVVPAHDQFGPPDVAVPIVEQWRDARVELVDMADHFLHGRATAVATLACQWFSR
jgi:uncharacterized protein